MADEDAGAVNAGLTALLQAERGALKRFIAARCGDPSDAEDLLQELWLKLAAAPTGPIANGRAYLFRMANNLVLDRARMRRRAMTRDRAWLDRDHVESTSIDLRPDRAPTAEEELIEGEEAETIRRAIDALPPGARRALLLYRFEGHGQAEIAGIMGISRSGVEKHLSLAMKHLRASLRDCGLFGIATSLERQAAGEAAPNRKFEP